MEPTQPQDQTQPVQAMVKSFSKKEAIKFGWQVMKENFWFFVGILLISWLIGGIPNILNELKKENIPAIISFIIFLVFWVLSIVVGMGLIKIAIKFIDGKKGEFSDLFSCFHLFFKYLLGSILYGLIVLAGTILLIVPGIIWSIKFQFFGYFIVDQKLGPIEALKRSAAITKGVRWSLFLFGFVVAGVNLLGALVLLIGLFATLPTCMVAIAFVYRKLLIQTDNIQKQTL